MEIERKFLVKALPPAGRGPGVPIKQGYLVIADDSTEVRIRQVGRRYEFALKRGRGIQRTEIETALTRVQRFQEPSAGFAPPGILAADSHHRCSRAT